MCLDAAGILPGIGCPHVVLHVELRLMVSMIPPAKAGPLSISAEWQPDVKVPKPHIIVNVSESSLQWCQKLDGHVVAALQSIGRRDVAKNRT